MCVHFYQQDTEQVCEAKLERMDRYTIPEARARLARPDDSEYLKSMRQQNLDYQLGIRAKIAALLDERRTPSPVYATGGHEQPLAR